jgi:hypothetical protein
LLGRHFGASLLPTQLTNLILLTEALLYGQRLKIACLARHLPIPPSFHHRQKRLLRFVANPRVSPQCLFVRLLDMSLALYGKQTLLPVIVDQTDLPMGYQGLIASLPYHGRALPFAYAIFHTDGLRGSQNQIENDFFALVTNLLSLRQRRPLYLLDRGYADVKLMRYLKQLKAHYIIRVPRRVWVQLPEYCGNLSGLNAVGAWLGVRYQRWQREPVNLATFWGKDRSGQAELIYLVTDLDPKFARSRYRQRMKIEEGFKDIKNGLGLKYLRLKVDMEAREGRLLLAVMVTTITTAYLYPWALAESPKVTKYATDQSFVSLVVLVCNCVWFAGAREYG